jgi:hypothetical protein
MRNHRHLPLVVLTLLLGAAACGSSDTPQQSNSNAAPPTAAPAPGVAPVPSPEVGGLRLGAGIEIGRSVNPDKTMYDATVLFIPTDKVWASLVILGAAPKATVQARWVTDGGEVFDQGSQEITPDGSTVVAFSTGRPDGWKVGKYRVEIQLNGVPVGSKDFEIRQPPL